MKVLVLYRPNSEHGRIIEDFINEYRRRHGQTHIEVMSLDTRDGSATATLYDIVEYPAILVVEADGYVIKIWQGSTLPRLDDVASYVQG
jgi:hypothetical protein